MSVANNAILEALRVAQEANAAAYRRAAHTSVPGECWDFVVLTATNEKQAEGYRQELALRHRAVGSTGAFFPAVQRSLVVADPPGPRIGSGGATFNVMRELASQYNLQPRDFDRLRILLIHSGGMSQRLPAYSPLGKIFAPLPLARPDGQISTLFDHLYLTLAGLPERLGAGMLILAGDVFLLFDHRHVRTPAPGVTAISMRVDPEIARGHGVFITDHHHRISRTLQKVPVQTMLDHGAADPHGKVLVDTGLLFFDADRTRLLADMAGALNESGKRKKISKGIDQKFGVQIDLYEQMAAALAPATDRSAFLAQQPRALMKTLWHSLHGIPFNAMQVQGEFLHLGTTLQFRDAMVGDSPSPAAELFQNNVLARSDWPLKDHQRIYHSVLIGDGKSASIGTRSVIEHSILRAPCRVGSGSVVSQVMSESGLLEVEDNRLLFQVPVIDAKGKSLFVHVLCGSEDDFKGRHDQGKCIYLNQPIEAWFKRTGLKPSDIWSGISATKRTLWTAKIFVGTSNRDSANSATAIARAKPSKRDIASWKKSPRFSMAMILESSDPLALIEHRERVAAHLHASGFLDALQQQDAPASLAVGRYSSAAGYAESERIIRNWASIETTHTPLLLKQARAHWAVAHRLRRPDHPDREQAHRQLEPAMRDAFGRIALASEIGHRDICVRVKRNLKLSPGKTVEALAPVRLDLAGGWTDTPPYCYDRGGHVINIAINLDDRPPVRASVKTLDRPVLILESLDLGQRIEVTHFDQDETVDVHDPFALHKVALKQVGLWPDSNGSTFFKRLGAGLHILTQCRVPKGSGLGTSSILAATLLGALHKMMGNRVSQHDLTEQTLLLEQRLSTGGGWQDQVGGIVGGIKSTVTDAGVPQRLQIEELKLTDAQYTAVQQRLVVYYSGQQRLARNILRRVMGRWLAREPSIVPLMDALRESTVELRGALLKNRWQQVGEQIGRYWQIKKELYPGSTTPEVDVLFAELRQHYLSAGLAGAGGGGFAYFFCKDATQADQLRRLLEERSARPGMLGAVYQTHINRAGLVVTQR